MNERSYIHTNIARAKNGIQQIKRKVYRELQGVCKMEQCKETK